MTNDKVFQMNFGKVYGLLLDPAVMALLRIFE